MPGNENTGTDKTDWARKGFYKMRFNTDLNHTNEIKLCEDLRENLEFPTLIFPLPLCLTLISSLYVCVGCYFFKLLFKSFLGKGTVKCKTWY